MSPWTYVSFLVETCSTVSHVRTLLSDSVNFLHLSFQGQVKTSMFSSLEIVDIEIFIIWPISKVFKVTAQKTLNSGGIRATQRISVSTTTVLLYKDLSNYLEDDLRCEGESLYMVFQT